MQTTVATGDAIAAKVFSAAFFAQTQKANTWTNRMTGPAPTQSESESKLRGQTDRHMPIVRVTDLTKTAGDKISVDLFHTIGGRPIMGDRMAEGKGERLTSSSMELKIDLATKVVDAGGTMTQKRTKWELRSVAAANLSDFMGRYDDQSTFVHLAGARGDNVGLDWTIPLQSDAEFAEIMINPVLAPSYNRHFVADGANLVRGGLQLASIDTTDVLKLEHIEAMSVLMQEEDFKLSPIILPDDPAAKDEPMYVLFVSHRVWHAVNTASSGQQWKTFLSNAYQRAQWGSKHPLFKGDAGMWGNILVKKMDRSIRFNPSSTAKYIAVANRYTATESTASIPALTAGYAVDRCLLLGGQALARVYGRAVNSDTFTSWKERKYNFERAIEVMGDMMTGKGKIRFNYLDANGVAEPTDHGVAVLDVIAPPVAS